MPSTASLQVGGLARRDQSFHDAGEPQSQGVGLLAPLINSLHALKTWQSRTNVCGDILMDLAIA
jgi:hypothetical protein